MRTATLFVASVLNALLLVSPTLGEAPSTSTTANSETRFPATQALPEPRLVGDLNADGVVNSVDLTILLGSWGRCGVVQSATVEGSCPGDLNSDEQVNFDDLITLMGNWN